MSQQGPPPGGQGPPRRAQQPPPGREPAGAARAGRAASGPPRGPAPERGPQPEPARQPPGGGTRPDIERQRLLGFLLVGLALLIGAVLLFRGFAEEDGSVAPVSDLAPSAEPEDDRNAPPEVEPDETTTTAPADAAPAPDETAVLVANAGGPAGAAGATTEELQAEGYQMGTAVDATETVASTQVQYAEGAEAAAAGVAAALGVGEDAVVALSDSPPVPDLGGAEVLVLLGPDSGGDG